MKSLETAQGLIKNGELKTIQDHVMKIIALIASEEKVTQEHSLIQSLLKLQNKDGGFGEIEGGGGSNAYGTGQALYGMRLAGVSPAYPAFKSAVTWLVDHQLWNGSWPLRETVCESDIAHDMWAVIGLAGAIDAKTARVSVKFENQARGPLNLELILDASGSMKKKIGKSSRMDLAKETKVILKREGGKIIPQVLPPDEDTSLW